MVTKLRWGAFHETGLDHHLKDLGVTQVVLCSGSPPALAWSRRPDTASEHGYHVVLVEDAMTDLDHDAHVHSLTKIFPRLGEVTDTAEVLKAVRAA